ncbi:uncharacterized protein CMC5_010070 [Chondromyces crocatus]|uniref:Uncharacterized protein n=1 Tax=Chondromyces crocatus TaxID=52 RepID=A0A0K1E7M4_CHOCO|nr:uncharacterized protein CMC5_010070 [Chondromyces crocatus]
MRHFAGVPANLDRAVGHRTVGALLHSLSRAKMTTAATMTITTTASIAAAHCGGGIGGILNTSQAGVWLLSFSGWFHRYTEV